MRGCIEEAVLQYQLALHWCRGGIDCCSFACRTFFCTAGEIRNEMPLQVVTLIPLLSWSYPIQLTVTHFLTSINERPITDRASIKQIWKSYGAVVMWKRKKTQPKMNYKEILKDLSISLKSRIWLKNKHTTKIRRNMKLHLQQFWFRNRQICIYFDFCNLSPSVQAWFSVIDPETFFVLGPGGWGAASICSIISLLQFASVICVLKWKQCVAVAHFVHCMFYRYFTSNFQYCLWQIFFIFHLTELKSKTTNLEIS